MSKTRSFYVCQQCGAQQPGFLGKCPECDAWGSLVETIVSEIEEKKTSKFSTATSQRLSEIKERDFQRIPTGILELDRVLGGGIVPGSVVLVCGEPGIGKSTLLLQLGLSFKTLYVSGEESPAQIKMRAVRLPYWEKSELEILPETQVEAIVVQTEALKPALVIVDSIQTLMVSGMQGVPGSIGQVRESAAQLIKAAKKLSIPVFIIGHVNKEGAIAGPRVLEHLVDTVLYLDGERDHTFRILRAHKNRFGKTSEIGIFEMKNDGLLEVKNPSEAFLGEVSEENPGFCVFASLEGQRPMLLEIQALVSPQSAGYPKRACQGLDFNRLQMLLAVLAQKLGARSLLSNDVYINVTGGLKVSEPAADLAVVLAIASSMKNRPLVPKTCVFGEVGLLGEIRGVTDEEKRISEAKRLGFKNFITPGRVKNLSEAIKMALNYK